MSLEHRGQVILYTMIMSELGYKVDSGLLLYLRESVLREVHTKHNEKRDLIMLRNELAYYLMQHPNISVSDIPDDNSDNSKISTVEDKRGRLMFGDLPEPINHHSACNKCPYSTVCTVLLT